MTRVHGDGPHVGVAGVVGEQRPAHVARSAARRQVVGGAEDGVAGVGHVAAEPVRRPRRVDELHGPVGPGGAEPHDAAHPGLDEVDRGQVVPRDPEPGLGLSVVGHQVVGRFGGHDPPLRGLRLGRRAGVEALGGRDVALHGVADDAGRGGGHGRRRSSRGGAAASRTPPVARGRPPPPGQGCWPGRGWRPRPPRVRRDRSAAVGAVVVVAAAAGAARRRTSWPAASRRAGSVRRGRSVRSALAGRRSAAAASAAATVVARPSRSAQAVPSSAHATTSAPPRAHVRNHPTRPCSPNGDADRAPASALAVATAPVSPILGADRPRTGGAS